MADGSTADELFTLGIAEEDGIVDDGRTWWYIGAIIWPTLHVVQAPTARAALAQFRRAIIDADVAKGESRSSSIKFVQAARLYIADGPLTTSQAYEIEVGFAWAWASCKWTTMVPTGPMSAAEVWPDLSTEDADRIRAAMRDLFLKPAHRGGHGR